MLHPFPVKALHDVLYWVAADAAQIERVLGGLLTEPPARIEQWISALDQIDSLLWSLKGRAEDARTDIAPFYDTADAEAKRAETAMRWVMAGLDV